MQTLMLRARTAALGGLAALFLTTASHAGSRDEQVPGYYRQKVGDLTVTALYDGYVDLDSKLLKGMQAKDLHALMERLFVQDRQGVQTAVNAYLVQDGERVVLVDAGAAQCFGPTLGALPGHLRQAGYTPADVDAVLLTHLHPDHACGLIDHKGEMAFPNATIWAARADADYWLSPEQAAQAPADKKPFFDMAQRAVAPYAAQQRVRLYGQGSELLPGFSVVATPGHTPGHSSYLFRSRGQTVFIWGDIVHSHSVQLPHPEVSIEFDSDQATAIRTRKSVLENVSEQGWLIAGAHLPFPGLGHIRKETQGYRWVPVEYGPLRGDR